VCYAADVFFSRGSAKVKIAVQSCSDIISIQDERSDALLVKFTLYGRGYGTLSTTAQTGEPQYVTFMAVLAFAVFF
jgi:hypothetical protein